MRSPRTTNRTVHVLVQRVEVGLTTSRSRRSGLGQPRLPAVAGVRGRPVGTQSARNGSGPAQWPYRPEHTRRPIGTSVQQRRVDSVGALLEPDRRGQRSASTVALCSAVCAVVQTPPKRGAKAPRSAGFHWRSPFTACGCRLQQSGDVATRRRAVIFGGAAAAVAL